MFAYLYVDDLVMGVKLYPTRELAEAHRPLPHEKPMGVVPAFDDLSGVGTRCMLLCQEMLTEALASESQDMVDALESMFLAGLRVGSKFF